MRLFKFTFIIASISTLTSCVDLPDINPSSNENVIVENVGWKWEIEDIGYEFSTDLDINSNGTADFRFIGEYYIDPVMGVVHTVRIEGIAPGNAITTEIVAVVPVCGQSQTLSPPQLLGENFTVNEMSRWGRKASFFWSQDSEYACTDYKLFMETDVFQFHGIKFVENGNIHYGWIQIKSQNYQFDNVYAAPERWKINYVGYNTVPGNGARIPG